MILLPIVDRELRVTARKASTYWLRFGAALAVLLIWVLLLSASNLSSPAELGRHLLNALGVLALGFCMLAGVFLTSDCLSEEKREGTLGLLFLTDLNSYDVVLGKLAATSVHAFFGLLAIFPILGLTVMLGGVTGAEFGRLLLVFVVTLFFSLGVGLLASAMSHEASQAMAKAFFGVVIPAGVLPTLWGLQWAGFNRVLFKTTAFDFVLLPSPGFAYFKGFDSGYRFGNGAHEYWYSLGTIFLMGLGCIMAANIILPRSWKQSGAGAVREPGRWWRRLFLRGKAVVVRKRIFNGSPIYWLCARDQGGQKSAMRLLAFLVPIWLVALIIFFVNHRAEPAFIFSIFTPYGMHVLVKFMITIEASRRMNHDRQSGAWELVLVTPISVRSILEGQKSALKKHFAGPLLVLTIVNLVMGGVIIFSAQALDMRWEQRLVFFEMFFGGIVMLWMDFYALAWVGMWRGLTARKHHRAVVGTLGQVMGFSWLFVFLCVSMQPRVGPGGAGVIVGIWFLVGATVDRVSCMAARARLEKEFRRAVLQGYHAKGS